MSSSRVRGAQAYILFYEKVEPKSSLWHTVNHKCWHLYGVTHTFHALRDIFWKLFLGHAESFKQMFLLFCKVGRYVTRNTKCKRLKPWKQFHWSNSLWVVRVLQRGRKSYLISNVDFRKWKSFLCKYNFWR